MSALDDAEHRAKHAEVWVAESSGAVVAAVTLTFAGQPYSEIAIENELEFRMLAVDPAVKAAALGVPRVRRVIEHAESLPNQHNERDVHGTGACPLRIPGLPEGPGPRLVRAG
ncbi:hypothetical protein [Arthrobacter sp. ZGTC131]|uniref:hypothetical protein n=1 Tax=Arthrobacter sp. ZGTC131 TaxID=2058898 RepID=UPI0028006DEB|nr:hypothetical protein [Arthrobacter sp. ZGTC131]